MVVSINVLVCSSLSVMRLNVCKGHDWLTVYSVIASDSPGLAFDQTPEWFALYVDYILEASSEVVMLVVVDEATKQPFFAMPATLRKSGQAVVRQLNSLSNYYTSLFQPVFSAQGQSEASAVSCFVSFLGNNDVAWDEFSLQPLAEDSPFFNHLLCSLDQQGYRYSLSPCFTNWFLPLDGCCYADYEQALPSKLRNTIRRKQRKLAREHQVRICIIEGESDLEAYIRDYERVYQNSWKGEESHPDFIRALIRAFAKAGWLRLGLLYVDDVAVAAQLWFVKSAVASIYKLSYDDDYAKYSVGTILTAAMMKQVIDVERVEVVDFLTGDDAYKKDWMSHQQQRYRLRIYNKGTMRGQVLAFWNEKFKKILGRS